MKSVAGVQFSKFSFTETKFSIHLTLGFNSTDQDLDQKSALEKDLVKEVTGILKMIVEAIAAGIIMIVGVTVDQDLVAEKGGDPDQDQESVEGGQEVIAERERGLLI